MTQAEQAVKDLEKQAMGNFENFGGQRGLNNAAGRIVNVSNRPKSAQAQFNIVYSVSNTTTVASVFGLSANSVMPIELFYHQNSSLKLGGSFANTTAQVNPLNATIQGIQALNNNMVSFSSVTGGAVVELSTTTSGFTLNGVVTSGFRTGNINPNGWTTPSVIYTFFDPAGRAIFLAPTLTNSGSTILSANPYVALDCREVPYRSLFDFTSSQSFNISKMRIIATVANGGAQFQNTLNYAKYSFIGGLVKNPISPTSFQSPFNQQANIVDVVNAPMEIDRQKGIIYGINMNEISGTIVCFCDRFSVPNL